jgi:DegV family protein with EDD domain
MIRIVTDSTADLPPELAGDIASVPCYVQFGAESYLDGVDLTREQFYERLTRDPVLPKTAAPSAGLFEETYRRVAAANDQIISLHVAATLSSMQNSARLGGQALAGTPVTVYNSESLSMGLGWLCIAAARAARAGKTLNEIVALLDDMKTRTHVLAALDTLEFMRRSGRVGWAAALVGQWLHIKPIVSVRRGLVSLVARVRTRAQALQRLTELVIRLGPLEHLAVMHTTAQATAQQLARTLAHLAPPPIPIGEVTPIIGTHVGPHGVGLAAVVKRDE